MAFFNSDQLATLTQTQYSIDRATSRGNLAQLVLVADVSVARRVGAPPLSISAARRGRSQTWPSQGTTSFWVQKVRTCNGPFSLSLCRTSCGPVPGSGRASKRGRFFQLWNLRVWCWRLWRTLLCRSLVHKKQQQSHGGASYSSTSSSGWEGVAADFADSSDLFHAATDKDVTPERTTLLLCGAVRALRTQRSKPNQLLYLSLLLLAKSELPLFLSSLQDQVL